MLTFGAMEEKKLIELGRKITAIRNKNKDTQYGLAKKLGVKIDTIKSLEETGRANLCTLYKVLNHYGAELRILTKP